MTTGKAEAVTHLNKLSNNLWVISQRHHDRNAASCKDGVKLDLSDRSRIRKIFFRHPTRGYTDKRTLRSRKIWNIIECIFYDIWNNHKTLLTLCSLTYITQRLALFESLTLSLLRFSCHPDNSSFTMFFHS